MLVTLKNPDLEYQQSGKIEKKEVKNEEFFSFLYSRDITS